MDKLPELGKIHPDFFDKHIAPKLGADNRNLTVRPKNGVDFGVIESGDTVTVLSTDPFYIAKELGIKRAAWFAIHILASDVAVSGIAPNFLSIDLNLPPEMTEQEFVEMWDVVDSECKKLGIAVATGHTARYAGCNYPMVGGATMFGIGKKERLIKPKAKPGELIVVTKGAAIETTGLMSAYFPRFLDEKYGSGFRKKAQDVYYQMSCVKDALIAARVGGVTAMHDATEGGVFGGLYEVANHSKVGMSINLKDIIVQDEVKKTCECFGINPYITISEGTLLATVSRVRAKAVVDELAKEGIPASIVGEVKEKSFGMHYFENGQKFNLTHPRVDPFWVKFEEYLGLSKQQESVATQHLDQPQC